MTEYGETKIKMWGLFALEKIPKGYFVIQYTGEVISYEKSKMRAKVYQEKNSNYLYDLYGEIPDLSDD